MSKFDLVVFDLAGTTVQDNGVVPKAFTASLYEFGIEITPSELSAVRGASKRDALAKLLGPQRLEKLDAIYSHFVQSLSVAYRTGGAVEIPGAVETFRYLQECGVAVALNTGFERSIVEVLISELNWPRQLFDAVVCGDEVENGRPAPDLILRAMALAGVDDPARVMNVGDTVLDMQAGARAGVGANVAVLSGAHSREQLSGAPYTHLLGSVRDVQKLFWAATI